MKVLCFGELLIRLSAPSFTRLFQSGCFNATFCGAEANVAVSLANFGIETMFLTKLPNDDIGNCAINNLKFFGVNTEKIKTSSGRMGIYYYENGASQRPSKVIYDRENSVISKACRLDFNWNEIFEGVGWFHWSGITAALSKEFENILIDACLEAKKRGIIISCDLNYRKFLWSSEEAQITMKKLMKYVDVCIANEEDAEKSLGIKIKGNDYEIGKIDKAIYKKIAKEISCQFDCKIVALTLRESYSASVNGWSGLLFEKESETFFESKNYEIAIVDRVGSGDSFAAGIIYSLIKESNYQETIEFAVSASCLKHTIEGDFNRVTVEEIKELVSNGGNGRVKR